MRLEAEGVRVKIVKNNEQIWPSRLAVYGRQESHDPALRVVINLLEMYQFLKKDKVPGAE